MAVTNGWGQGAVDNTIEWGQGASDNTISWGKSQTVSAAGETNITGSSGTPAFSNVYSFDFGGIDDTFAVNSASAYAFTGDFTIMAWVKVDAIGNNHYIIDTSTSAGFGNGYSFRVRTDGKIRFWSYSASQTGLNSTTALVVDTWYHIACVHTSTQNKIYINGSLDATLNWSTGHSTSNTTNLKIASSNVLNGFTNGHIDEVAFFNTDQSANISAIYNSGTPTDLTSYAPLGWFRMGDNAVWNGSTWTMTSVGSQTNTAISANMLEASRTTDVPIFSNTLSTLYNGIDDYISLGSRTQNFTDFSISVWFKTTPKGGFNSIIGNSGNEGGLLFAIVQAGGVIRIRSNQWLPLSAVITDDAWHHLAVTYDSNANELKSYIDKSLFVTIAPGTPSNPTNSHSFNQIGRRTTVGQWLGNLDELAVFSSVLSASDV